jgi:hypothetical protein
MLMVFDLVITNEDGSTVEVRADQRDVAMWEMQPFGSSAAQALGNKTFYFTRWLAWHALRRTKKTTLEWSDWNDATPAVEFATDEEGDVPDPGNPAASGAV